MAGAHKYQLWVNGTEARYGSQLLLPRRAVLPGDRRHVRSRRARQRHRPPAPLVRGRPGSPAVGAGPARPPRRPFHRRHRRRHRLRRLLADHPGEWLPGPYRNTDGSDFVENIDGRLTPLGWPTPVSTTAPGRVHRARPRGDSAVHPSLRPAHPHRRAPRQSRLGPDTGHGGRGRRLRQGLPGTAEGHIRPGSRGPVVPLHVGYSLDADGAVSTVHGAQGTDLCFSYTQRDGVPGIRAVLLPRVPLLPDRRSGRDLGHAQVTAIARHAAMPTVPAPPSSRPTPMLDDVWELTAVPACTRHRSSSSIRRHGRRARSCGTGPTSPRR